MSLNRKKEKKKPRI